VVKLKQFKIETKPFLASIIGTRRSHASYTKPVLSTIKDRKSGKIIKRRVSRTKDFQSIPREEENSSSAEFGVRGWSWVMVESDN